MADIEKLNVKMGNVLVAASQHLLEGTMEDIAALAEELATDLVTAAAEGNEELLALTISRARLLGERLRIRATGAAWAALAEVARTVVQLLKAALL